MIAISNETINEIVNVIKSKVFIEVEASGRHIHLSRKDVNRLFGEGYVLTKDKELSQPGQYACKERISIKGPKGIIKNVVILGPERAETQIELSLTDSLILGIKPPLRLSGDIENSAGAILINEDREIQLQKGVIIAKRHIHMTLEDAQRFNVKDGEIISIKVFGTRPVIFEDVNVRVSKDYSTDFHIDYDEANGCGYSKGVLGIIVGNKGKNENLLCMAELASTLTNKNDSIKSLTNISNKEYDMTSRKLIVETDLQKKNIQKNGVINIQKDCIITPAAKDYIQSHNVSVKVNN